MTLRQRDISRNPLFADPFGDCCNQCFQGASFPAGTQLTCRGPGFLLGSPCRV